MKNDIIPRGLIVSCQALKDEPLYGGNTIPKMAYAAKLGGAVGIRANTVRDINAIHKKLKGELPIIGLIKQNYPDSPVYITPTLKEVKALIKSKCSVIALDATNRPRPGGVTLKELVQYVRDHSNKALMADIATFEEAEQADKMHFDYVSTTLRSYTKETEGLPIPSAEFCKQLRETMTHATIIAEGGIHTFEELADVLDTGIDRVVVGSAITRPQLITGCYVKVFSQSAAFNAAAE